MLFRSKDQSFLARLREEQVQKAKEREPRCSYILADLVNASLATYDKPLDEAETTVEQFEKALFDPQQASPAQQKVHLLKRRVSLMKRLLWQTLIVVHRITPQSDRSSPHFQDVGENCESYHFYADELLEEVNNLLSIHLAMASHRTNEVMRVLTVFSAFFLPLTFIVGIYGMNFEHMPELHHPFGYGAVLLVMVAVSGLIFVWFRRRGWLRRPQTSEPRDE